MEGRCVASDLWCAVIFVNGPYIKTPRPPNMIIHHLDPKSPTSIPSSTTATTLQPFLAAIPVDPPGMVVVATGATVPSEPPPEPLPEPEPLVEPGPLPDSVRNGAVRPSWGRTRTDDISSSRPVFSKTCPTS